MMLGLIKRSTLGDTIQFILKIHDLMQLNAIIEKCGREKTTRGRRLTGCAVAVR